MRTFICMCVVFVMLAACSSSSSDDSNGDSGTDVRISGNVDTSASGGTAEGNMVIAQNSASGETAYSTTDENGDFRVSISSAINEDKRADTASPWLITVLGANGKTIGTLTYGEVSKGRGGDVLVTGLNIDSSVNLGTISVPADTTTAVLSPGSDGDVSDSMVDSSLYSRKDANGVTVGLASKGKGSDAILSDDSPSGKADQDRDGLPDILDADDDGDGIVDEFDDESSSFGFPEDVRLGFFMNLKLDGPRASPFYSGDQTAMDDILKSNTVLTLEVLKESGVSSSRNITAVKALPAPAPAYLSEATFEADLWSTTDYAFTENTSDGRFDVFVTPNALIDAGDAITVEVSFDDGSKAYMTRMINYAFKSIPKLIEYGAAGSLMNADETQINNNRVDNPIEFDGNQDLVLVFEPPEDELGNYVQRMDYKFAFFYNDSTGAQVQNIDWPASTTDKEITIPSIDGGYWDNGNYWVMQTNLIVTNEIMYRVTIPKEAFLASVIDNNGVETDIETYKIDITAERDSNNASVMLIFAKQ